MMENNTTTSISSLMRSLHIWILGITLLIVSVAFIAVLRFDTARLALFGPTAQIYFFGIRQGLFIGISVLLSAIIYFLFFEKQAKQGLARLGNWWASVSNLKQNILVLLLCLVFVFASNGGNILNGYFNMDDLTIVGLNHLLPFKEAVSTPYGNDHAFPLFITEMKILDLLFGQNPAPYNFFFFILFSLVPFFVYLTFKKLGFGMPSFLAFLLIFGGASGWTEIITGFYIMSIYPQILLFFSIASWAYVAWKNSKSLKYMVVFAVALILATASDTSGIWVIPVIILFMTGVHYFKANNLRLKENV